MQFGASGSTLSTLAKIVCESNRGKNLHRVFWNRTNGGKEQMWSFTETHCGLFSSFLEFRLGEGNMYNFFYSSAYEMA